MARFVGIYLRGAFVDKTRNAEAEFIVEMEDDRTGEPSTFIAYGRTASTLSGFMLNGETYLITYIPLTATEFRGEIQAADGFVH